MPDAWEAEASEGKKSARGKGFAMNSKTVTNVKKCGRVVLTTGKGAHDADTGPVREENGTGIGKKSYCLGDGVVVQDKTRSPDEDGGGGWRGLRREGPAKSKDLNRPNSLLQGNCS